MTIQKYFFIILDKSRQKSSSSTTRVWNLKRHLQSFHSEVYKEVMSINDGNSNTKMKSTPTSTPAKQPKLDHFIGRVTVSMTKSEMKDCLLTMVVRDSVPFSFFNKPGSGFRRLNGQMAEILGISLERRQIRRIVMESYENEKQSLILSLKGRYVHLKIDSCTRLKVNYVAINIRFVNQDCQMVTKTLAVRDSKERHDSSYLQGLINQVLNEFHISEDQVICLVSDNASNMIKTVERINQKRKAAICDDMTETDADSSESDSLNSDSESETGDTMETAQFPRSRIFGDDDEDLACDDEEASVAVTLPAVSHMRCGAHTLQLAIRDGLKEISHCIN